MMVAGDRTVGDGVGVDATYQYITERSSLEEEADDVVYATDPEPAGGVNSENVPEPPRTPDERRPDVDGQTTLDDWRWSA